MKELHVNERKCFEREPEKRYTSFPENIFSLERKIRENYFKRPPRSVWCGFSFMKIEQSENNPFHGKYFVPAENILLRVRTVSVNSFQLDYHPTI